MLGILGGMGPMATVDFMRKLVEATPADVDQDHLQTLVCSASQIPDRSAALLGLGPDPLPAMIEALRRLERAGATHIAIPCNTAHLWHPALQASTALPILHIVDAVVARLRQGSMAAGPVGLLATSALIDAGLYQERLAAHGFAGRSPKDQAAVMHAIRLVKAGEVREAGRLLRDQAEALLAAGCGSIVLACTEVPLALAAGHEDLKPFLVDATDALARACVAACATRACIAA